MGTSPVVGDTGVGVCPIVDGVFVGDGVVGTSPAVGSTVSPVGAGNVGTSGPGVPGEGIATGAGVGGIVKTGKSSS